MSTGYTDIYTTIAGDMWDMIAYRVYGDERYMAQLMEANPDVADVVVFGGGVDLVVPDVAVTASAALPPWRR